VRQAKPEEFTRGGGIFLGDGAGFNDVALTPAMNKKPNIAMANAFLIDTTAQYIYSLRPKAVPQKQRVNISISSLSFRLLR
jgi:hypothetical protein